MDSTATETRAWILYGANACSGGGNGGGGGGGGPRPSNGLTVQKRTFPKTEFHNGGASGRGCVEAVGEREANFYTKCPDGTFTYPTYLPLTRYLNSFHAQSSHSHCATHSITHNICQHTPLHCSMAGCMGRSRSMVALEERARYLSTNQGRECLSRATQD